MRFEFECRPLASVSPWGGDRPVLHWFGLTEGWYWASADEGEFLRYTAEAVRRWNLERPHPDYYVARLWEDLIVLRRVLDETVPEDLVPFVDGTFARREFTGDDLSDEADTAFDLQSDHHLYLGYLATSPALRCWRHGDAVTLSQRITAGERDTFDGPPLLAATVTATEFFAAIEDFDRRFLAVMDERVTELERDGPPPGVDLDLQQLRQEHQRRVTWLSRRLSEPRTVDWAAVRAGAAEISSWPVAGS